MDYKSILNWLDAYSSGYGTSFHTDIFVKQQNLLSESQFTLTGNRTGTEAPALAFETS